MQHDCTTIHHSPMFSFSRPQWDGCPHWFVLGKTTTRVWLNMRMFDLTTDHAGRSKKPLWFCINLVLPCAFFTFCSLNTGFIIQGGNKWIPMEADKHTWLRYYFHTSRVWVRWGPGSSKPHFHWGKYFTNKQGKETYSCIATWFFKSWPSILREYQWFIARIWMSIPKV